MENPDFMKGRPFVSREKNGPDGRLSGLGADADRL
jgi:hypothetical protein